MERYEALTLNEHLDIIQVVEKIREKPIIMPFKSLSCPWLVEKESNVPIEQFRFNSNLGTLSDKSVNAVQSKLLEEMKYVSTIVNDVAL